MAFDETLDKTLHVDRVQGDEDLHSNDIELRVASYNNGPPKLQLTRISPDGRYGKLGRMSKVEIERVRDKMTELLNMEIEDKPKSDKTPGWDPEKCEHRSTECPESCEDCEHYLKDIPF